MVAFALVVSPPVPRGVALPPPGTFGEPGGTLWAPRGAL